MANLIEIIIRARDEASAALQSTAKSFHDLEKAATTAALPFAGIAAAGTAVIAKTTLTAARTEELGVVIENLGRVSGYSKQELEASETSIKQLGITTQGARTIMSRFMGAELDLADATKIARAAQDLAVISMEDSSTAAENLTYAIASMQPRVLRQYGIFVNLNDVYEKTAVALGKQTDELTENEKRQGMLNAILEQAGNFTGTYEAAMETAGKQLRSLNRYTEQAAEELGEHYLPYLGLAVTAIGDLLEGFSELDEGQQAAIASTIMYATVIAGSIAATMGAVVATSKLIAALQALKLVMATHPLLFIPTALAFLATATMKYTASFNEQKRAAWEASETLRVYQRRVELLLPDLPKASAHVRGFARDAGLAARETAKATAETEWWTRKLDDQAKALTAAYVEGARLRKEAELLTETTVRAAEVMSYDMANALAGNILGIRENVERYRELENTVSAAYVDMTAKTRDYNDDIKKINEDRAKALVKLEEELAYNLWYIEAGGMSRSAEETQRLYEWQQGLNAQELTEFNALWDGKEGRRTEDYELAKTQAWGAAEERRKAEEAARLAEMEAIRAAQEERLILFALEMAEHADLLKIPLKGWEEVEVGAQEYMDLVSAGIIPVSKEVMAFMGDALAGIVALWDESEQRGDAWGLETKAMLSTVIPDVMNLGTEGATAARDIETEFDTRVIRALMDGQTETEELGNEFVAVASTTYSEARKMETSVGGYTGKIVDSSIKTGQLEDKTERSFRAMRGHINRATTDMDEYKDSIKGAIDAFNRLRRLEGQLGGAEAGLQMGLPYVPATMRTTIHEGEAVLTKQQAEAWRAQNTFNFNVQNAYGVYGLREAMDEYWWENYRYRP